MGQPFEEMLKIDAEVRVPIGTVQLVRFNITDPIDMIMFDRDAYWLELSLQPRPQTSLACYTDHWTAHRFKRLGTAYVLPPGETIRTRTEGGLPHASVLCLFNPDSMQQWFDGELEWTDRRLEASLDIVDTNIRYLMNKLAYEMQHPSFASNTLMELISAQLTIELGRYLTHFDEIPITGKLAVWRVRLIEERLREVQTAPTLDELAALCKLSVRQLTRGFRASFGCSIGDYIASSRVEHAKRMLAGDQSIKAIAYSLGFNSPSRFGFAFRRATGLTPGEFRASASGAVLRFHS